MASYNLNSRFTNLENRFSTFEKNTDSKFISIQNQQKIYSTGLVMRIDALEKQIKDMEVALQTLQQRYEENQLQLSKLEPKVGQKRKWWQVI